MLGKFVNLEELNLCYNHFKEFPTYFCLLNKLKEIQLEWFRYTNPPMAIKQN